MKIIEISTVPSRLESNQMLLVVEPRAKDPSVPPQIKEEVEKMQSLQRRQEYCQSRAQIFRMVSTLTGQPESEVQILKKESGKPYLKDDPRFRLNVSHASEFVGSSLSLEEETGFDIETIARFSSSIGAKEKRWLHPEEIEALAPIDSKDMPLELCRLWTKKEAYSKAKSLGLGISFRELSVFHESDLDLAFSSIKVKESILSCSAPEGFDVTAIISEKSN